MNEVFATIGLLIGIYLLMVFSAALLVAFLIISGFLLLAFIMIGPIVAGVQSVRKRFG